MIQLFVFDRLWSWSRVVETFLLPTATESVTFILWLITDSTNRSVLPANRIPVLVIKNVGNEIRNRCSCVVFVNRPSWSKLPHLTHVNIFWVSVLCKRNQTNWRGLPLNRLLLGGGGGGGGEVVLLVAFISAENQAWVMRLLGLHLNLSSRA